MRIPKGLGTEANVLFGLGILGSSIVSTMDDQIGIYIIAGGLLWSCLHIPFAALRAAGLVDE